MPVTRITVGGKFPTNTEYTSQTFEVKYELEDSESLEIATKKCKLLVAETVGGGDYSLYKKALEVLSYDTREEEVLQRLEQLLKTENQLESIKTQIEEREERIAKLLSVEKKAVKLESLVNLENVPLAFGKALMQVLEGEKLDEQSEVESDFDDCDDSHHPCEEDDEDRY
ncbi:MAG: hypothetical protein F6K39_16120 [Okeania sp. SIO3B3]|nr:hypothetical protein [Okeania sp. SIO3B3]